MCLIVMIAFRRYLSHADIVDNRAHAVCGNPAYAAPEVLSGAGK